MIQPTIDFEKTNGELGRAVRGRTRNVIQAPTKKP
jgi:hypothetical protein